MKKIGLIGGVSWQSTVSYYAHINQKIHARLGGHHSAKLLIDSLDFEPFVQMKTEGARKQAKQTLRESCEKLHLAGASCLLLCSNTLHMFDQVIQESFPGTFLHLATCTTQAIQQSGMTTVGLLGTRYTMQRKYYRKHLEAGGLNVLIPPAGPADSIHRIIVDELVLGEQRPESKMKILNAIEELAKRGAEGMILGCTELPLLITPEDTNLKLFDTVEIHAEAAVSFSLQ